MNLEDFSNKDNIEIIYNHCNLECINEYENKPIENKHNIDFLVNGNNNLVISLNLTKNIINNIKQNSSVKLEFLLSKHFYLSILDEFK